MAQLVLNLLSTCPVRGTHSSGPPKRGFVGALPQHLDNSTSVHSRRATVATACLGCRASTSAPIVTVALHSRYGSRFIGNGREAPHKAIWPVTGRANRHLGLAGSSGMLAMCLETTLPATEWVARWHCRQCHCCCRERPWGLGCCQ